MNEDSPIPTDPHMDGAEFERLGRDLMGWIVRHLDTAEDRPVQAPAAPGEIYRGFPASPPLEGESLADLPAELDRLVVPGVTGWQNPNWFAYFPCNHSYPSVLGELLSAGLGIQGMLWNTSPACTELESLVMDWSLEAFGLPDRFRTMSRDPDGPPCAGGGVIQDTASSATFCEGVTSA